MCIRDSLNIAGAVAVLTEEGQVDVVFSDDFAIPFVQVNNAPVSYTHLGSAWPEVS